MTSIGLGDLSQQFQMRTQNMLLKQRLQVTSEQVTTGVAADPARHFPWQEEALAVCQHKPNVYIDLSGWSPKYFPEILVRYANTMLRKKMLFGSDWPMISPERWLDDFEKAPFRDEVRDGIMKGNAAKLLGLA